MNGNLMNVYCIQRLTGTFFMLLPHHWYSAKLQSRHKSTNQIYHSSSAYSLYVLRARRPLELQKAHKSPSSTALTLFVQPWPFLSLGHNHRVLDQWKLLWPKGTQGQVACCWGQQLSITPPGPKVKPLTSVATGCFLGRLKMRSSFSPPPLPLTTQVSEAPVLTKGQRFHCNSGTILMHWIGSWWATARAASGSINTEVAGVALVALNGVPKVQFTASDLKS